MDLYLQSLTVLSNVTIFQISSITTGVAAVGGLVLTLFPPTAPIGAATLISSSIVGAPGAAYGTGNSAVEQQR